MAERMEPFRGTVGQMSDSPHLASTDLMGFDEGVNLVIEDVLVEHDVKTTDGRTEKTVYSLKFKKTAKRLWLNATNRKTLARHYGAKTEGWIGQEVNVYVDYSVKAIGGGTTTGLRLRPVSPDTVGKGWGQ